MAFDTGSTISVDSPDILLGKGRVMRMAFTLAALAALAFASDATASGDSQLDLELVRTSQVDLKRKLEDGRGQYAHLSGDQRQQILARQDRLLRLLDGKADLTDLAPAHQATALNELEWIKAAISEAEADRVVCEHVTKLGSNRRTRVCKTVRELEFERARDHEKLRAFQDSR